MGRTLLLMRHAKSSWDAPIVDDAERVLSKRGRRDAPRMGEWLASEGLAPDYVVCSPAVRARQTAEAVLERVDLPSSFLHYDARIYAASAEALLAVLADTPDSAQRVLLVGHNPGLDDLCYHLCGGRLPHTGSGKLMTTAAVAQIALPDTWSVLEPGAGRMIRLMRPKALRP